ncbi:MAG: hypothetical protein ACRELG_03450, partial [Gemmataceae bacterium]
VQLGSVGLLLVSALVFGGVIAWVVGLDAPASAKPTPDVAVATTTKKPEEKQQPQKPEEKERPKKPEEKERPKEPKDPVPDDPKLRMVLQQLNADDVETNDEGIKGLEGLDPAVVRHAIPAVVDAAERQNDKDFRQRAVEALIRIGDAPLEKDYRCLKKALQIEHAALRRYAVNTLEELGNKAKDAMDVMVEALKHRDQEVSGKAFAIMKTLGPTARAPALRLLLNPNGDADEEASLGVLKKLLDGADPLPAGEIDVLAEAMRDVKRRIKVRCFAVENLGKGEQAARAIPALLAVLREKGDAKLLTLSIKALGRIGDTRKDVLTSLWTVATSAAEEENRLESLQVLDDLDSSALSVVQIVQRWPAETSSSVRQKLAKMLHSRIDMLKPEKLKEQLLPLLQDKDPEIVLEGLKVVQARKQEAAVVAVEVAALLKRDAAEVREAALKALEAIGSPGAKDLPKLSQQLLDRWSMEKDPSVQRALTSLLLSRLKLLEPEQMTNLRPLLRHKDTPIILVGLKVVQVRKQDAAVVAVEVAALLHRDAAEVREAALNALEAIGLAGDKDLPKLSQQLLAHWTREKDSAVRLALTNLLKSRLSKLKPEKLKEQLLLLLQHKDPEIILVGLKVVRDRKKEAADVAAEIADLLNDNTAKTVREEALATLKTLGPAARKALPKLFEILKNTAKFHRTPLALTVAEMVSAKDAKNVESLVPILLEGLHPNSLKVSEAAINRALVKIGQPAVNGIFTVLTEILSSANPDTLKNFQYRKTLYETLAEVGAKYKSPGNHAFLQRLWKTESKKNRNDKLIKAARAAMDAVDPE